MKAKRMRLTSKTVCKMHRLARELEAFNGVQVSCESFVVEGRRAFCFAICTADPQDQCLLMNWSHGVAFNIRDALANFYDDMGYVCSARRHAEETGSSNIWPKPAPARFTTGALRCWGPGIHGKQVVLSA